MPASDHLQGQQFGQVHGQLPMFMTGREIIRSTTPGDSVGDHGRMWKEKLTQFPSFRKQLADEGGVHEPVAISAHPLHAEDSKPTLMNGHHRTIFEAAYALKRLLPVVHATDYDDPDSFKADKTEMGYQGTS